MAKKKTEKIKGRLGIREIATAKAKTKRDYYKFKAYNMGKALNGKIFQIGETLKDGDVIECEYRRDNSWGGKLQLVVENYSILTALDDDEIAEIFGDKEVPVNEYFKKMMDTVNKFKNNGFKQVIKAVFSKNKYKEGFLVAPAATKVHHNYVGGLCEHTYNVFSICKRLIGLYDDIDSELLLSAAILHDIGKIDTYETEGANIKNSMDGQLFDHIYMGAAIVQTLWPNKFGEDVEEEHLRGCYDYKMHYKNQTFQLITGSDVLNL